MKNSDRQKKLDLQKYFASKQHKQDLSGKMAHCYYCGSQSPTNGCRVSQEQRVAECLCAKAYNRFDKKQREKK